MTKQFAKTVIVTGGAGFLGSWLCQRQLQAGHRVIAIDSLISGCLSNIDTCYDFESFSFIQHDIVEPLEIDEPVHEIYNLACPASPVRYQADPIHTFETSVLGVRNMLRLAGEHDARFLQASTSEVYGDPRVNPQPETYFGNVNTFGPRSCYDEGKRAAETLIREHHVQYGLDTRIARIFNTYGPRMRHDDGRVVSNFIVQALSGEDLSVFGDGKQTRSFCYLDDQIDGLEALMAAQNLFSPVNIGNPDEKTVLELAERVLKKTGSASKLAFSKFPEDDPHVRRPDITKAREFLGWEPKVSLNDGLDRTIEFFRRELESGTLGKTAVA